MRYLGRDRTVFMWYLGRAETVFVVAFWPVFRHCSEKRRQVLPGKLQNSGKFMRYLGRDRTVFMWYLGRDKTIFFTPFLRPFLSTVLKNTKGKKVVPGIFFIFYIGP